MDLFHLSRKCTCYSRYESAVDLMREERQAFSPDLAPPAPSLAPGAVVETFPFMRLPCEFRAMIYKLHFLQPVDGDRTLSCLAGDSCPRRRCNGGVPVRMLLLVSRAIYEEAMPIFFRTKTFCFLLSGLTSILAKIRPQQRQYVSKLVLRNGCVYGVNDFLVLQDCPSLQDLTIIFHTLSRTAERHYGNGDLVEQHGLEQLLQIRGLKRLEIVFSKRVKRACSRKYMDDLVEALQVLKQPYPSGSYPCTAAWKLSPSYSL